MTTLRTHLEALEQSDDLVSVAERTHWDGDAATVAREAIRNSTPAVLFEDTPGDVRLASGAYAGPNELVEQHRNSWYRISAALGLGRECTYVDLLDHLSEAQPTQFEREDIGQPAAEETDVDLHSLGLPTLARGDRPLVTLGLIAVERDGHSTWAPIRGTVRHATGLRAAIPEPFAQWCEESADATVLLGVSAAALIAALQGWTGDRITEDVPELALGLSDGPLARDGSRLVPGAAEVQMSGTMRATDRAPSGPAAAWEQTCDVRWVDVDIESVALREEPIVPFTPLGAPLSDDVLLTGLVEAAQLYRRVNGYWGVSPVRWIRLPFEARLGLCLVSSEILYAGFEWQLANTLFSFSRLFDKVLVLDEHADANDLARAMDDMWVKAHPSNDWTFSESNAPSASAPRYRRGGETGARLYINATWDPRWDEEYIAPRVTFETSYPENIRAAAKERWNELLAPEEDR